MSLLTIAPALCELYATVSTINWCCSPNAEKCAAKPMDTKKQTNGTSKSCTPCRTIQNCSCYFTTTAIANFKPILVSDSRKLYITNEKVVSNYLSDCWHPPELA